MRTYLGILILLMVSCSNGESIDNRTKGTQNGADGTATKAFPYDISTEGFNLLDRLVEITSVRGGFVGCSPTEGWNSLGASGTVVGSSDCTALTFYALTLAIEGGGSIDVSFDSMTSSYTDALGNVWVFRTNPVTGSPVLAANFDKLFDGSILNIDRNALNYSVTIDDGDGPVCDTENPFTISYPSLNVIAIDWGRPAADADSVQLDVLSGGTPSGSPPIVIDGNRFLLDFSSASDGTHDYDRPLRVFRGDSQCVLKDLTVTLNTSAQ